MKTGTNQPAPIKGTNRIAYLDILRGIAIFFILCANIVYFSGYFDYPIENRLGSAFFIIDDYFELIMYTLVDGKFYSIFSLLFGIGCVIQYKNLKKHNKPFAQFFRRRMLWLLMIGLIHLIFLWMGDILTLYAILGLTLIWFVNLSNSQLLKYAVILILLPIVNWLIINAIGWNYPLYFYDLNLQYNQSLGLPISEWQGVLMTDFIAYLESNSLLDFFKVNIGNAIIRLADILNEGRAFKVLGIFLIGLWAGRKILDENILDNTSFLKKVAIWGICIGLPISIIRTGITYFSNHDIFWSLMKTLSYAFGTVPLAIGYVALLALLYKKRNTFLKWFAPVGKMALTNYLLQTLLATTLFYGIGFGFVGKFGYTLNIGIAVIIFSLQVVCSKWWLKTHQFGPMEWIWRQLTYGKRIKNKIGLISFKTK
ncbi:DUF418 domain-containing protein [uncultured Kriegella sp.]|uniref:DUF418 domain-containing protein n=1 Tax=uncultured Kriegella sp. TaxID=1798910 RepID=UPI0030DD0313|tara:strand:+ start:67684 stop:68958 length:1275 start_codon:yes stop_codon:yes gene_type:complete